MNRIDPTWFANSVSPQTSPVRNRSDFIEKMRMLLEGKGLTIHGDKIFEADEVIKSNQVPTLLKQCEHGNIKGKNAGKTRYYMAVVDRSDSGRRPEPMIMVNQHGGGGILRGQFPEFEQKPHIVILPMAGIKGIDAASFSCIGINPQTYGLGAKGDIKLSKKQYEALLNHAAKKFPGQGIEQLLLGKSVDN